MSAKILACAYAVAALLSRNASAQAQAQVPMPVVATTPIASRTVRAPAIDGLDVDDVWRTAVPITAFRMFDPIEDSVATLRTEARIAYDEQSLFVFVRAFDPRPDSIIALLSRRDVKTASDQIKIMIDSYHDRRTGYEFAVNPAGVKRDYYTYDDNSEDGSWDAVWDVATRIDSLGWTAEFRIPLSQLRYPPRDTLTFGVMIMRDIARYNERDSWPVYRRSRAGIASQFGDVGGFASLGSTNRLELTPYVLTRNTSIVRADGFTRSQQGTIGADFKYGITSNLTLNATINPDFGQVEADPATLNLTAFETFLAEQRPFFLEGTGIFGFGDDPTRLFYSRRIGRAPQLAGLVTAPDVDIPGASRILGAGKLSGRLADGTSLGVLAAVTDRTMAGETAIEPGTAYAVARATRDLRGGESGVGVIATVVERSLDDVQARYLRRSALGAGVDARHRFGDGRFALAGSMSTSMVRGSRSAITRTQRAGVHQYQRPDGELVVDTLRESLSGVAMGLSADKVAGTLRGGVSYQRITPGYETNDLGFLSRADQQTVASSLRLIPKGTYGGWRNSQVSLFTNHGFTDAGLMNGGLFELYAGGSRANGSSASIDA
jgi:hypothetical protein